MPAPADLRPAASGTLAKTPLAHVVVFIAEKRLDGTLVLRDAKGGESLVAFAQGAPGKVKTSFPSAPFGRVLIQLGLVDHDTVEGAIQQVAATGEPIGEYLLALGKMDRAQLVAALREQVMRRMIRLFEQVGDDTAYEFYAGVNLLADWGGPVLTPIDPFRVLWEGVNARPNDPRIEPTLTRLGTAPVRILPNVELSRFGFGPPEMMLIDLLRAKPMSIDDLVARAVLPIRQTKLLAYALLITKSIAAASAPGAAVPSPVRSKEPSSPDDAEPRSSRRGAAMQGAPVARVNLRSSSTATQVGKPSQAPSATDLAALREEIKKRVQTVASEDFFVVLGIARDAPPDVVRSAYFALAKKWHPDRLPAALDDVRDDAAKIFARISDAHATLTDGEKRQKYMELLKAGGAQSDEQAKVQQVIEATFDFQKAEVFAKKRDFEKAEALARRAMEADPEQPDYLALYAWILAHRPDRMAAKDFAESLSLLNSAIAREPRCERARFYRGTLLKMLGKDQAAVLDFREAAELNPRNIDAIREVRLWEMRGAGKRERQPSAPPTDQQDKPIDWKNDGVGEIFGRLFKKK